MTLRTKLEAVGVLLLLAIAALYAREWLSKHDAILQAQMAVAADQKQVKAINDALSAREQQYEQQVAQITSAQKALQTATSAQIAEKVPVYIPQATKPIVIVGPEPQLAPAGSAIVPAEDIKPMAQTVLDGEQCKADLTKCNGDLGDWQRKYELADDEGKQWQKAAKGGSVWKRVKKAAIYIGIGAAVGYAAHR